MTFLDVEPKHLELFVRVNPYWDGKRLHVLASLQQHADHISAVTGVIKYCMHWQDFSETRWAGVGPCARKFVWSLFIGIEEIVKLAQASDKVMNWHLNGFNRADGCVQKECLVNHMDSCRFDDQEFERFSELWEQFTAEDVSKKLKPPPFGLHHK